MTDKDSTILVMGPRGAGKSKFIELLAGPTKLQPNGVSTDNLRTISVSPYFSDGKTIKFVKFPGFDESDTGLTDAELFVSIATFLGSCIRRPEKIRSIIYLHPVDRSNDADVKRNITMLLEIVQDAVQNIVVVTTGGDQTQNTDEDIEESELPRELTGPGLDKPLGHDGTKLSALIILDRATKKTPILLDLKHKIPWHTDAGKELVSHIRELMKPKKDRDDKLGEKIEEEEDEGEVKKLEAEQAQLRDALSRLDGERKKLGASINWDQVTKDSEGLERVIKEQRDYATKDWKAEYDKQVAAYDSLRKEKNAKVARYDSLLKEKNALQTEVYYSRQFFSFPVWGYGDSMGTGDYLPYSRNEALHTHLHGFNEARVLMLRNSAGRIGVGDQQGIYFSTA